MLKLLACSLFVTLALAGCSDSMRPAPLGIAAWTYEWEGEWLHVNVTVRNDYDRPLPLENVDLPVSALVVLFEFKGDRSMEVAHVNGPLGGNMTLCHRALVRHTAGNAAIRVEGPRPAGLRAGPDGHAAVCTDDEHGPVYLEPAQTHTMSWAIRPADQFSGSQGYYALLITTGGQPEPPKDGLQQFGVDYSHSGCFNHDTTAYFGDSPGRPTCYHLSESTAKPPWEGFPPDSAWPAWAD